MITVTRLSLACNRCMVKRQSFRYTERDRMAEEEMDQLLQSMSGMRLDISEELRKFSIN